MRNAYFGTKAPFWSKSLDALDLDFQSIVGFLSNLWKPNECASLRDTTHLVPFWRTFGENNIGEKRRDFGENAIYVKNCTKFVMLVLAPDQRVPKDRKIRKEG